MLGLGMKITFHDGKHFFTVFLTSKSCVFLLPTTNTSTDVLQFDLNTAAARSHWEITHRLLSIQSAFPPHCPLDHPSHSQQTKGLRCAHPPSSPGYTMGILTALLCASSFSVTFWTPCDLWFITKDIIEYANEETGADMWRTQ